MASVEVIGLLCAGSTRYYDYGGISNAGDRLSRAELAGILSGMDRVTMNMALAKYACDVDAERLLTAHVRVWAAGKAIRESWKIVKGRPTVSNMAALAVFEVVRPNRCYRCEGRGIVSNRVCLMCEGSGYKALTGRKIAEIVGVDECNYRRVWRSRYEQCFSFVRDIDSVVGKIIRSCDNERICAVY